MVAEGKKEQNNPKKILKKLDTLFLCFTFLVENTMEKNMSTNQHEFRSDVRKVLNILTHSLYTNREIFLRELLSNASDALDKVRFLQSRGDLATSDLPLEITIEIDKDNKKLVIKDSGIGMKESEMIDNLGTIAKSGSEEFLKELNAQKEGNANSETSSDASQIIGRFGVGFYSVFMVSEHVEVISTYADDKEKQAHIWTSSGEGTFTLEKYTQEDAPKRGTHISITFKEDALHYLEEYELEGIIRKHSSFLPFPVKLGEKLVNTTPAIWREPKSSLTQEQYNEFYTFLTYDEQAPMGTIHFSTDSPIQFNMLVFIPNTELDLALAQREQYGLDLYAKRILINRDNNDLVPNYLAFLKGVVDTEDLPLNISRETLQENVLIRKISQTVTKQALKHLERVAKDDNELYEKIWNTHNKLFKLGYMDYVNRESFIPLLRFNTSLHEDADKLSSLDNYIENASAKHGDKQKTIWFIQAQSREACKLHPLFESFRRREIEVLFLYEPIDEIVFESIQNYKEFNFKSIEFASEEDLKDFPETSADDNNTPLKEEEKPILDNLLAAIKAALLDKVKEVRASTRLASAPAVLVGADGASSSLEKLLRTMNNDSSIPQKIFEINPNHPLIHNMMNIYKANPDDPLLTDMIHTLFETSQLLDGYIQDPFVLANRVNTLLQKSSGWYTEIKK